MSQERLALDAGMERSYVSDLERGMRNPSVRALGRWPTLWVLSQRCCWISLLYKIPAYPRFSTQACREGLEAVTVSPKLLANDVISRVNHPHGIRPNTALYLDLRPPHHPESQ